MTQEQSIQNTFPKTGNDLIALCLKKYGVSIVYGVIGIPITQLSRSVMSYGIRFVAFHNEQAATMAAGANGYLTGFPGVAMTVSGPGMVNAISGLANATVNGFPFILISGSSDVHKVDLGQGEYQALDQLAAARPFAKAVYKINDVKDVARGIIRAISTACTGRPGGVYLDIPAAVLHQAVDASDIKNLVPDFEFKHLPTPPHPEAIDTAAKILNSSSKPLIIFGKGAAYSKAEAEALSFIEKSNIPFIEMPMAKGLIKSGHKLCADAARSLALANADTIILVGARLNWLLNNGTFNQNYKLIQIDIQPDEFDAYRTCEAPILGDITLSLSALSQAVQKQDYKDWISMIESKKTENIEKLKIKTAISTVPMNFSCALSTINSVIKDYPDLIYVTEGANTLDVGRSIIERNAPRSRLDTGTWGTMGVGLAYAVAAATTENCPVLAVEGDAAFGFTGMELETINRYKLPIVVIVFNNGGIYKGDAVNPYSSDPDPTRFVDHIQYQLMAQAFGCEHNYVTNSDEELKQALVSALKSKAPAFINCIIDSTVGTESGHLSKMN